MLALLDGRPFGLVQRSRLADYPDYQAELAAIVPVPDEAVTIDYLIGDPGQVGKGLGTLMIRSIVERTWVELPDASCVLVPVAAGNLASWNALRKAGLRRVAAGELEPDHPEDDRDHYLYRIDRPTPP
ncbi:GNAT family N-acetyltransferase [Nonomuraea antimicrobica]